MNQRGLLSLPRNWRVITVASLTTLGLAYGAGQPAQGEWWSLPKAQPETAKVPAAKPVTTENGFSATIHRLMSDARLYADKGELDKAVQLAERAAKISEASSQLLGPASDCSPEKTALFVNELRTRRDAVAKRTLPAPTVPTVVATTPRRDPATQQARENASTSPPPQPLERLVVERAIAERAVSEQPAELAVEPLENPLAWAEELPPTPTPEAEPVSKPIKFRRSVLTRASLPTGEESDESRTISDEVAAPRIADAAIDELLEVEFTSELSVELEPTVPSAADTHTKMSLNDPISTPSANRLPSLKGGIQPVAAEAPTNEATALPAVPARQASWEDEAFAEELLLGKSSRSKSAGASTETTAPAKKNGAPPFPEDAFPVQRVVQLRRRLETAASLNPGGAYTMPSGPATEPARETDSLPSPKSEFEIPAPASVAPTIDSKEEAIDGETLPEFNERPQQQTANKAETAPMERPVVRLREHRVLPDQVRAALLKAAALPPAPTTRRHIVGYSEPMLWQSADEHDSVLPSLSFASGIGGGTSGPHNATGASLPPDLRDISPSARPGDETHRAASRVSPAVSVEQTGFRSIELPSDSIQRIEPSGPALSSAHSTLADTAGGLLAGQSRSSDSITQSKRTVKHPTATSQKPEASSSKASHEVSRQSFAIIEPLASALQLPIATTASLLGGAGLALLGLGLLLVRAAIRWRHS